MYIPFSEKKSRLIFQDILPSFERKKQHVRAAASSVVRRLATASYPSVTQHHTHIHIPDV